MSATPPEASSEYSKGPEPPKRGSGAAKRQAASRSSGARATAPPRSATQARSRRGWPIAAVLGCALLGALLLLIAEFTTLFQVHAANVAGPIKSVSTGANDSYALIPIALAVVVLAFGFWRSDSRPSLLAIGVLGIVVLLIALLGDLPDAQASGLIGSSSSHYVDASSTPTAGLYLETLGAILLLIACGCGFLLIGPPARTPRATDSGSNRKP